MEINKNSTSILLVEQNASEALKIAHRGYVFSIGEIVLKDTGKNLLSDEGKTRGHILKYELFEFEKGQPPDRH